MKEKIILICGGSGMIGQAVSKRLHHHGYTIKLLTRSINHTIPFDQYLWDPYQGKIDKTALNNLYGVINLSGASIGSRRWSSKRKQELFNSRILSTRFIISQINALDKKPAVFVSVSGIGIYGNTPDNKTNEKTPIVATDFLSELCIRWEAELNNLHTDIRRSIIRVGLVLSKFDGILAKSIFPAKFGLAPIFGSGKQFYSWIHIQDLVSIVYWLLERQDANGIYNAVANTPVTQSMFAIQLSKQYHSRYLAFHLPHWLMRWIIGAFSMALFTSQYIVPLRLNEAGFVFEYNDLNPALKDILNS